MLNLQEPRVVDLLQAGRHYRLHFRRITDADYRGYYERITSAQERGENGDTITEFDSSAAKLWLVETTLSGVNGYTIDLDGVDATDVKQLAKLLPARHKLAAADFLLAVETPKPTQGDAQIALSAEEVVELTLPRGWTCAEDGASVAVTGLKHFFKTPSAEQSRKLRLAQSRSVIEKSGRTRDVPYGPVAMELYGELIARVDGYDGASFGVGDGTPLPAQIAAAMDGLHKVHAISELFNPAMQEVTAK